MYSNKNFLPVQNYNLVKEKLEAYSFFPSENEIAIFFQFFDEAYQLWLKNNPQSFDKELLDHKVKVRRLLNNFRILTGE